MAKNLGYKTVDVWLKGTQKYGQNRSNWNMFFDGDIIYSYGKHFPLAIKLDDGCILLNGDTYSVTTSDHQSEVRSAVSGAGYRYIILPFSSLPRAVSPRFIRVVDVEADRYFPYTCKRERCLPEPHEHKTHLMGRSVFTATVFGQEKYYLSGIDETFRDRREGHFLAELPYAADTVADALEALKPEPVKDAEDQGIEVRRQGEWFFIPRPGPLRNAEPTPFILDGAPNWPTTLLQHKEGRRMPRHSATHLKTKDGKRFAKGTVRHSEGDHKMLTLGNTWHEVWENTEVAGFRGGGRVD